MKNILYFLSPFFFFILSNSISAQDLQQNIKGIIVDKDSQIPLIGATISITSLNPTIGTDTDIDGSFILNDIPIGRHNLEINYLGYEPLQLNSILLTSGKELVLNLELIESTETLTEVVVSASQQMDKTKPINEMATVSARSFSVEETSRYAASLADPARMALNYAGVSIGSTDDLFNEIVIRGNSPAGVMWRLEGIQIPNPNHFGSPGNSGGGISMLSSTILSNSDFYTGAFPSEFGNALSGVFDLKMRNGNNGKREHSFMFGMLGIELATEGPFSKKSKASYLFNYRYSTLALIEKLGISPTGDILPAYQDLSFKINVPTKKAGTFGLFGIGGLNSSKVTPERDSSVWEFPEDDSYGFEETQHVGTVGLSHSILLGKNSYLKTVMAASYEKLYEDDYNLNPNDNYAEIPEDIEDTRSSTFRISSTYNNKLSAKSSIRTGVILSRMNFEYSWDQFSVDEQQLIRIFDNKANAGLIQAFAHWKYRIKDNLTLNTGLHYTQMTLNNKFAIEPRAALQWNINNKQSIAISAGLHSKMEHLAAYTFEGTFYDGTTINAKKDLGLTKSFHSVIAYDYIFNSNLRLKAEAYYQYLYDIPVENVADSKNSLINATDIWDIIGVTDAVQEGTGTNMGLDLTFEKFFNQQYYFLVTGSLYDSKFKALDGNTYNTRFNGNYQINLLGGKEFTIGKREKNIFGINAKFALSGGNRITPIDLETSILQGENVLFEDQFLEGRAGAYYRLDMGVNYKINAKNKTHTISIDIQNVTNRANPSFKYYSSERQEIVAITQTGLFPTFNYRIEF